MESTRTPQALNSTDHYEVMIDTRSDRVAYEIWSEGFGHKELVITVHMPSAYGNHTVDPYLGYETTNIQTPELAAAFAETFKQAADNFATVVDFYERSKA